MPSETARGERFGKNTQKPINQRTNQNKRGSILTGPPEATTFQKCRVSIARRGSYPEPGQAPKQVPTETKHSDKSAGGFVSPDPATPPADNQSAQVTREIKGGASIWRMDKQDVL